MKTLVLILVLCVSQCLCGRRSFLSYTLASHNNGATLLFQAIGLGNTLQRNTDNPILHFEEFAPSATLNSNNSSVSRQDASVSRRPCKTQVTVRGPQGRFFLPSTSLVTSYTFMNSVFNLATTKYCYTWDPAAIKPLFCRRKRSLEEVNRLYPTDVLGLETTAVPHFVTAEDEVIPDTESFSSLQSSLTDDLQTDCEPTPDEASETEYELEGRAFFSGITVLSTTTSTVTLLRTSVTATLTNKILFAPVLDNIKTYCIPHEYSASELCS